MSNLRNSFSSSIAFKFEAISKDGRQTDDKPTDDQVQIATEPPP